MSTLRSFVILTLAIVGTSPFAVAQTDRLYPSDGAAVIGKIKSVSKNGIVITVGSKDQTFAAGEIRKVLFQGDPPGLTRGRESALSGQFEDAIEELKTVEIDKAPRAVIADDAAFYLIYAKGQQALAGRGGVNEAIQEALAYVGKNTDSWHFYETANLLGDLALAVENYDQAMRYYGSLRQAPSTELKIQSVYQSGMVNLAKGDLAEAASEFQKVIGVSVKSAAAVRLQTQSKASLAVVKAKQGDGKEAMKIVNELVENLIPTDVEMAANVYNAQGASLEAMGDDEGAILAYLHTHLMFSTQAQSHVQALRRLADLWTKVGKPDRAAQVRGELQQRYPGLSG